MKVFICCALPQDERIHLLWSSPWINNPTSPRWKFSSLCSSPRWRFSSYMLLPKMKVFILYATPRGKGSHLLCSSPRWRFELAPYNYFLSVYGWAIGFIYYKSIVIIVVALLLISDLIMHLQLFVVLLLSGIKLILIPYDWHHRCVLLLGGYWLWVWYNPCQPCQGQIDQGGCFALIHHVAFLSQFLL